jgi:hypothetical protein
VRDALTDAVVDPAAGQNHLRLVTGLLRAERQIVRIDPDAVTADEPRGEFLKIPLGASRGQHVAGIDAETPEQGRKLVHESDVKITLGVFDDFCRLRHFD